jgi:hypothetical protein
LDALSETRAITAAKMAAKLRCAVTEPGLGSEIPTVDSRWQIFRSVADAERLAKGGAE